MSCEGHNDTNMSMFWISFDPSVSEDDIIRFQRSHLNQHGGFVSNGRFVNRVIAFGNAVIHSWEYMAATKNAAYGDLARWLEDDKR